MVHWGGFQALQNVIRKKKELKAQFLDAKRLSEPWNFFTQTHCTSSCCFAVRAVDGIALEERCKSEAKCSQSSLSVSHSIMC